MATKAQGTTHISESDDDPTIDELIDALSFSGDEHRAFASTGFTHEAVEMDQEECTEELLAPDALFSKVTDLSF